MVGIGDLAGHHRYFRWRPYSRRFETVVAFAIKGRTGLSYKTEGVLAFVSRGVVFDCDPSTVQKAEILVREV